MNDDDFNNLLKSISQAAGIKRGEKRPSRKYEFSPLDVKKIREDTGLSQRQFSKVIHVSIKTLQNWEQGRRYPQGPALALLTILKKDPQQVVRSLNGR